MLLLPPLIDHCFFGIIQRYHNSHYLYHESLMLYKLGGVAGVIDSLCVRPFSNYRPSNYNMLLSTYLSLKALY